MLRIYARARTIIDALTARTASSSSGQPKRSFYQNSVTEKKDPGKNQNFNYKQILAETLKDKTTCLGQIISFSLFIQNLTGINLMI